MATKKTKQIVIDGFIWAKKEVWQEDFSFAFYQVDGTNKWLLNDGHIPVAPYQIVVEFPEGVDLKQCQLKSLQEKRKLILAENQQRLDSIDLEIEKLQAIEHKPEPKVEGE